MFPFVRYKNLTIYTIHRKFLGNLTPDVGLNLKSVEGVLEPGTLMQS